MSGLVCHEDVTRQGISQPCDKTAVAMRLDPEERTPYPVCAYHARADMVPLADVIADAVWQATTDAVERLDAVRRVSETRVSPQYRVVTSYPYYVVPR